MPQQEAPIRSLSDYLPVGTFELITPYLHQYRVHLTITRSRATVLGDYRNAHADKHHRISINGNLNPFAFLITLLHELAHLITFIRFGHRVESHGKEWQQQYADLLQQFLQTRIFPIDITEQLKMTAARPAASSCADADLMRVLRRYDFQKEGYCLIEELAEGEQFIIKGGRIFKRNEKVRKRIKATEVSTGKVYVFSPVYEVKKHP